MTLGDGAEMGLSWIKDVSLQDFWREKPVRAVEGWQLGGHRVLPGQQLLQDRWKCAGGGCVFLSGLPPQGLGYSKPLCCGALTVQAVCQTTGYTSVWELFLVISPGVEHCQLWIGLCVCAFVHLYVSRCVCVCVCVWADVPLECHLGAHKDPRVYAQSVMSVCT